MLDIDVKGQIGRFPLDVQLQVRSAQPLSLIGPNGAGKSSLLHLILGALRPRGGRIAIGGFTLVDSARGIHLPIEARRLGYLPQDLALFPHRTVLDNVVFGLRFRSRIGAGSAGARQARELAYAWLQQLGIEQLALRRPETLSGGERQKVALARALAGRPSALLLDEPMAALDLGARRQLRRFLTAQLAELHLPVIIVTHDPADVAALTDQVAVMESGRIVQVGNLLELRRQPVTDFAEEFIEQAAALRGIR